MIEGSVDLPVIHQNPNAGKPLVDCTKPSKAGCPRNDSLFDAGINPALPIEAIIPLPLGFRDFADTWPGDYLLVGVTLITSLNSTGKRTMKDSRASSIEERVPVLDTLLPISLFVLVSFMAFPLSKTGVPADATVMVQDFENPSSLQEIRNANRSNDNATVELSTDHPHAGKQCLKLQHRPLSDGTGPVIRIPVRIEPNVRRLRFMIYGDNSGCRYSINLVDAAGKTFAFRDSEKRKIDFNGWKEIVIDLNSEHWATGGDHNGKINSPLTEITFKIDHDAGKVIEGELYFDSLRIDPDRTAA